MKLTLILLYFPPNFSGPFILVAGEMCVNQMCNKRPHTWLPELISTKDRTNNNYYVERLKEFMVISVVDDEECLFYLSLSPQFQSQVVVILAEKNSRAAPLLVQQSVSLIRHLINFNFKSSADLNFK